MKRGTRLHLKNMIVKTIEHAVKPVVKNSIPNRRISKNYVDKGRVVGSSSNVNFT